MIDLAVYKWRTDKAEVFMHSAVNIETGDGGYLRDPVGSIDYDLEKLTLIMDKVFKTLDFSKSPSNKTVPDNQKIPVEK